MMILLFLLTFFSPALFAQHENIPFDNTHIFHEGIYTSFDELRKNAPKYSNCRLEIVRPFFGKLSYYIYYDSLEKEHDFDDSIFATVFKNILFLYHKRFFYKRYYSGAITIFLKTGWITASQLHYKIIEEYCRILDLETGKTGPLKFSVIDAIIRRDPELYKEFQASEDNTEREYLIKYILKYNERNPFYF